MPAVGAQQGVRGQVTRVEGAHEVPLAMSRSSRRRTSAAVREVPEGLPGMDTTVAMTGRPGMGNSVLGIDLLRKAVLDAGLPAINPRSLRERAGAYSADRRHDPGVAPAHHRDPNRSGPAKGMGS
jgi:hypothetical protein